MQRFREPLRPISGAAVHFRRLKLAFLDFNEIILVLSVHMHKAHLFYPNLHDPDWADAYTATLLAFIDCRGLM